jgi:NADH-quinone oxidoreductase subunit N
MVFIQNDFIYFLPEIFLGIMVLILLIFGVIMDNTKKKIIIKTSKIIFLNNLKIVNFLGISVLFCVLFLYFFQYIYLGFNYSIFNYQVISDNFIVVFKILILIFTILILNISSYFFKQEGIFSFEYVILILVSSLGLLFFVSSNDFFVLYLSLELQSLSLFILCAIRHKQNSAIEASLKFFIIGSVSSGFLLFGCSLVYGNFGLLNFFEIKTILDIFNSTLYQDSLFLIIGVLLVLVGFFFKLAIAPFHLWLKDIYEGAPILVIIYIAIVPKLAIICIFSRFCQIIFYNISYFEKISLLFFILAIFTVFIGITGALFQKKIKSFIAYSSITNMGYLLYLFSNIDSNTLITDFIFYSIVIFSLVYVLNILSIFILILSTYNWSSKTSFIYINQLSGLYKTQPLFAIFWLINLFSLIGLPPLAGFFGKFYLSLQIINSGYYFLTFLFLLFGFIAAIYYLWIIKLLFFDKLNSSIFFKKVSFKIACYLCVIFIFNLLLFVKIEYFIWIFNFIN